MDVIHSSGVRPNLCELQNGVNGPTYSLRSCEASETVHLKHLAWNLLVGTPTMMAVEAMLINVSQLAPEDYRQKNLREQKVI